MGETPSDGTAEQIQQGFNKYALIKIYILQVIQFFSKTHLNSRFNQQSVLIVDIYLVPGSRTPFCLL